MRFLLSLLVFAFAAFSSLFMLFDRSKHLLLKSVALFIFLAATFLLFQRDTHLAFLGPAVFPPSVLKNAHAPEGSNVEITIPVNGNNGDRIIYWGANSSSTVVSNPWDAYKKYENAGIATIQDGKATLRFHCPGRYAIPSGQTLQRHIHYRTCCVKSGMFGRVETAFVEC